MKSGMISLEKYENINPDKIKPSDQTTAAAAGIKFYENIDTIYSKQPCNNGTC